MTDGKIRSVLGPRCYILRGDEELYEKPLSAEVEKMLKQGGYVSTSDDVRKIAYFENSIDPALSTGKRDKTKVIAYRYDGVSAVFSVVPIGGLLARTRDFLASLAARQRTYPLECQLD